MSAAHGSSPGARRGDRFKWLETEKNASDAQVAGGLRIESPGHWVMGMQAEAPSRRAGSPPPSHGRLIPRPPSKLGAESESSLHGWGSLGVAVIEDYTSPADGARRGRRSPPPRGERPAPHRSQPVGKFPPRVVVSGCRVSAPCDSRPQRHSPAVAGDSQCAHQLQLLGCY